MGMGETIADRLLELSMSQRALAERAGISEAAVSRILSGDRAFPRGDTLLKLARGLGITVDELLKESTGV